MPWLFRYTGSGNLVSRENLEEIGVEGFCLRLHVIPDQADRAKLILCVIPENKESLLEANPLGGDPRFPSLAVLRAEIPLGIKTASVIDTKFGHPLLPVIIPAAPVTSRSTLPPADEIITKMASLLRNVNVPEVKINRDKLAERMAELASEGDSQLKDLAPDLLWPSISSWIPSQGKDLNVFKFFIQLSTSPDCLSI